MFCALNLRRQAGVAGVILAASGGFGCASATAGATPPAPDREGGSAEQACLDAANGERQRRADEPHRIGLRHILVRHRDAKRADAGVTRGRGEACLRALEALKALEAGQAWDETVASFSEERGAAGRSGSLGSLTRDDLDPAFADAAFELDVDQLSYVVESPSGFHVILRVE